MLEQRIELFVAHITQLVNAHFAANLKNLTPPVFEADFISDKWCRIVQQENSNRSVYCFVALADNTTKGLGVVKAGDIHKAAGWKAPAKTARGSVFAEDFGKCCTPYGVVYLR